MKNCPIEPNFHKIHCCYIKLGTKPRILFKVGYYCLYCQTYFDLDLKQIKIK